MATLTPADRLLLPRFELKAPDIELQCESLFQRITQVYDSVGSLRDTSDPSSYTSVLKKLAESERDFATTSEELQLYMYVSPEKDIREASTNASKNLSNFATDLIMREDVFQVLSAFEKHHGQADWLTGEHKRFLDHSLRNRRRLGLHLEANVRKEVAELTRREAELGVQFEKNLNDENTILEFSEAELEGLQPEWLASLERSPSGNLRVTLKYPHYRPVMQFCRVRSTRIAMERAFNSRCIDTNVALLEQIVQLREKRALSLGYPTHAAYVHEILMAKSPENVRAFLEKLATLLAPLREAELGRIRELMREESSSVPVPKEGEPLALADMSYYQNMVQSRFYNVDQKLLREYFPLPHLLDVMFDIYQNTLNIRFQEITKEVHRWHDDVQAFAVFDREDNHLLGFFYLDLFPREGKFSHAMALSIRPPALCSDGKRQLPISTMVCNFPRPETPNTDSILSHFDVLTLFHEFGHVMHQLLTQSALVEHTSSKVERDFLEMPSQMFENWVWERRVLQRLGKHYMTGAPLPDALLDSLVKSRVANTGVINLRQIAFALFDIAIHSRTGSDMLTPLDTSALFTKILIEYSHVRPSEGTNFAASFAHLCGGYDAQYYGYHWSQVYSSEMYAARFEQPATKGDTCAEAEAGAHLRRTVLSKGGSRDGFDLLREFLGREPDPQMRPFLKNIGVL